MVYGFLESLVHTHVKDLRPAVGYVGGLHRVQDVLVFFRVMSKETAQVNTQTCGAAAASPGISGTRRYILVELAPPGLAGIMLLSGR